MFWNEWRKRRRERYLQQSSSYSTYIGGLQQMNASLAESNRLMNDVVIAAHEFINDQPCVIGGTKEFRLAVALDQLKRHLGYRTAQKDPKNV